jgi:hypothetical protein
MNDYMDKSERVSIQTAKVKRAKWKIMVDRALQTYSVVTFMSILTIYTLFFDDIRVVAIDL